MPLLILPFNKNTGTCTDTNSCNVLNMMSSPKVKEEAKNNAHLLQYLHMLPIDELGLPEYYEKLDRKMTSNKNPNIIYPSKNGIYTHILHDHNDGRNTYIPIEPSISHNLDKLVAEVEKRLLDLVDELNWTSISSEEDRAKILLQCIDKLCVPSLQQPAKFNLKLFNNKKIKPLVATPRQILALKYLLIRDKIGLGILEPIVTDKYVEDISCSGMGMVFVEHKIFKSLKTVVNFPSNDDLDTFVMRLAERIKKPVSVHNPIVDATLPDGSRINIVYGRDVSKRGSNFTIRKFSETPLSVNELIDMGTLNYMMAAYLSLMLGEGMNVFVCGETASGKTTTLNAITTFIHPNAKIVSIEDTPELQVPHANWIREVVRSNKESDGGGVAMFDLLKAALRQRPNEIIIGEIRGEEGAIAFQAMQTGHSVMATFHAASVERLIQRLTGSPINVPKSYIDNLNLAIFQSAVKLPSGQTGRRMVSINEIIGFDPTTQSFLFTETFRWDSVTDAFTFSGDNNSYLLDYKISPKRGIPSTQRKRIYVELERRAKILETLNKQGVKDFYALLKVLGKAQKEGLF